MKTNKTTTTSVLSAPRIRERLGNTPALSSENGKAGPPDSRDVSLRWLAGTILTGVTSITLMGGALLTALDGQNTFRVPEIRLDGSQISKQAATSGDGLESLAAKGDHPLPVKSVILDKEILRLSTLTRAENGTDRVRTRPFARVTADLAKRADDPSFEIPKFDPVAIFSSEEKFREKGSEDKLYEAQVDDEIAIQHVAFPINNTGVSNDRSFSDDEIEASIRHNLPVLKASLDNGTVLARAGTIAYVDPKRFELPERPKADPFAELDVVISDENVSSFAKTNRFVRIDDVSREEVVSVSEDESIAETVRSQTGSGDNTDAILATLLRQTGKGGLSSAHELRLGYAGTVGDDNPDLISLYERGRHILTLGRNDAGNYVNVDRPEVSDDAEQVAEPEYAPFSDTYRAIYETALKNDIPQPLIRELIRIYAFDVDFRKSITKTDKMEVFYSLDPDTEAATEDSEVLYTAVQLGDAKRRYYRFKTDDDGEVDYYDENGRSAKKFLMRQPVPRAKFRSSFGWRKHPILGKTRLHKGVDWSAKRGTPIFAAGNGVVEEAKWFAGYGRWVKLRHANGYKTGYAHMSRFAKGIKSGVRVRQGQIIGYVGSTGLSTGPHLHYEVIVNGRHVNPMRIRLPRGRVLSGDQLVAFERERDRINQLLRNTSPEEAQTFALNNR